MLLIAILTGTLIAGVGSVWLAALLSFGALARYSQHLLSLAAGALLATAFMHLLPEATGPTTPMRMAWGRATTMPPTRAAVGP